ncbi:MAG: Trk system potassium transporter TrkA [Clostridia bacterium]|nr:Trk system potassium transporter TrkA [Clostridia bacterium]
MKIVIAGIGKFGDYLTRQLAKENNEITVIDINFTGKEALINNEDINNIEGNALDVKILEEAGVQNSDLLIASMKEDSENVMCALLSRKLGVKNTIARIRRPEYIDSLNMIKEPLGLSMIISPKQLTANQIAQTLSIPSAIETTSFFKGRIYVISLKLKEDSKYIGQSIKEISQKLNGNIIVCAIEREDSVVIPNGETIIQAEDKIHITGTRKDINSFLRYGNLIQDKTRQVMIVGGSDISKYLANQLADTDMKVKIVEPNKEVALELAETLDNVLVINADPSDEQTLFEEGIQETDAFVALTGIDEENIVYSMFASSQKVPKVITKINHINLSGITQMAKIDAVVSPHKIAANQVVQYVRAMEKGKSSSCESIYNFGDNIFEMIEFKVKEDFKGINQKLEELKLQDDTLIGAIQRGKNIIYPQGKDEIRLNDTVLVICRNNKVKELNDMIK